MIGTVNSYFRLVFTLIWNPVVCDLNIVFLFVNKKVGPGTQYRIFTTKDRIKKDNIDVVEHIGIHKINSFKIF